MSNKELLPIAPRDVLVKQGMSAMVCLAGGILSLLIIISSKLAILGIVLSVAALACGIGALFSRDREAKIPGLILTAAGAMGLLMRSRIGPLESIAGTILGIGVAGLFAMGIWKGIKFLIGLKSRG